MRFRLHTTQSASSGQVTTNIAALDALLLRVDELESAGGTSGAIEITGANDTFIFRIANNVYSELQIDGDYIHPTETYTLVLAERDYMPTEMVAALNVAIVVHDNESSSITGTK